MTYYILKQYIFTREILETANVWLENYSNFDVVLKRIIFVVSVSSADPFSNNHDTNVSVNMPRQISQGGRTSDSG